MSGLEFTPWPKMPRLNRDIVVTEKIDGTNAAVVIVAWEQLAQEVSEGWNSEEDYFRQWHKHGKSLIAKVVTDGQAFGVFAQSRTRFITPADDNFGFAAWVQQHAEGLVATLGEGIHFGEWWGHGIQRHYELSPGDRRFSLFNTARWALPEGDDGAHLDANVPGLGVVPVLYEGPFDQNAIDHFAHILRIYGSKAAPGFMRPEGVVIWHTAARHCFKVTLEADLAPKSAPEEEAA